MNFADWAPAITAVGTILAAILPLYIRQGHIAKKGQERTEEVLAQQAKQHKENIQKLDLIAKQTNGGLTEAQNRIAELENARSEELRVLRSRVRELEQQLRNRPPAGPFPSAG